MQQPVKPSNIRCDPNRIFISFLEPYENKRDGNHIICENNGGKTSQILPNYYYVINYDTMNELLRKNIKFIIHGSGTEGNNVNI
jgi:hypothetical protein